MALDLAKMKAKLQELEGGAKSKKDNVFWKPTEGDQDIRIVPTSDGDPFKVFHFHYNLGEAARGGVLCPKRQFGEHCPICEFASSLWQEESSESKKMAKNFSFDSVSFHQSSFVVKKMQEFVFGDMERPFMKTFLDWF
jgi:hypothetical protein